MTHSDGKDAIAREIERQIAELEKESDSIATREEVGRLRQQLEGALLHGSDPSNDAWRRVLLARHPQRPHTLDYIHKLFTEFTALHGDRRFADDPAMVCGLASFEGKPVMVIGHQKGRDTKQKLFRNFGMTKPEGYRKAMRLMQLAAKFGVPIITMIDTPGAYPGIGAEERGQAEAIAHNLKEIPKLKVPIVVIIHGEGGSGGALAIAVGDHVLMLENSVYSVIAPESCSSILWRDWDHKHEAARLLKLTAEDLHGFGLIDQVVPEPKGGAQNDLNKAVALLQPFISDALGKLKSLSTQDLLARRHQRLRRLASFVSET
ncbi:MAG TPA: acetyl-CoA carboxylase carboxyltransferase subunit alpha [Terriglobia bacterium]|nr:acetyl-CoA carboxylase carboxyltransferase subunit alpha [Terriglobia bacterium]